jgi:hypothetical protein
VGGIVGVECAGNDGTWLSWLSICALVATLKSVCVRSDQHVRSIFGVSCQVACYPRSSNVSSARSLPGCAAGCPAVSSARQYASLASAASISCLRTTSWICCAVLLVLPARTTFLFCHRFFAVIACTSLHGSSIVVRSSMIRRTTPVRAPRIHARGKRFYEVSK